MKVGVVVDGVSEYASLGVLFASLHDLGSCQLIGPTRADIQPHAPVGVIVRQCLPRVNQFVVRGAGRVIVLIDREDGNECPGQLAERIRSVLAHKSVGADVRVVIKNRTYENWVIADIGGSGGDRR